LAGAPALVVTGWPFVRPRRRNGSCWPISRCSSARSGSS
jgi:hypothetical protein